jgi:hypothetical protein
MKILMSLFNRIQIFEVESNLINLLFFHFSFETFDLNIIKEEI